MSNKPTAGYETWLDYVLDDGPQMHDPVTRDLCLAEARIAVNELRAAAKRCHDAEALFATTALDRFYQEGKVESLSKKLAETVSLVRELNQSLIAAMVVVWSDANTSKKVEAMMLDKNIPQDLCSRADVWLAEREQERERERDQEQEQKPC